MAVCTLDLSRPCFVASFNSLPENDEIKKKLLDTFKEKVERDHVCCHRVVQKFYGNKKFVHLHEKIWKYDWGESSASNRKSWRMVVVVPEPHIEPFHLIAAAIYTKNVAEQLSFKELAAIFANATGAIPTEKPSKGDFHRVPNGDGKTRCICGKCLELVVVSDIEDEMDAAEEHHRCDLAEDGVPEDSN